METTQEGTISQASMSSNDGFLRIAYYTVLRLFHMRAALLDEYIDYRAQRCATFCSDHQRIFQYHRVQSLPRRAANNSELI
jgi:hypothetical protein